MSESTAKQLVGLRLKGPGMNWSHRHYRPESTQPQQKLAHLLEKPHSHNMTTNYRMHPRVLIQLRAFV